MKIVVVDTVFLEQNHLDRLNKLGEVKIFDDVPQSEDELVNRLKNTEIAILGWSDITSEVIVKLPHLKMISLWATGYDYVDIQTAKEKGIIVTNVPGYAAEAVAEHVFSLLLSFVRKISFADKHVKTGHFNWKEFRGIELAGKTMGIIGLGSIGSRVARISNCFGLNVIAFTTHPTDEKAKKFGVEFLSFDEVLSKSDFLTIHIPLSLETENLLGFTEFSKMKNDAIIINTSRGQIINETALIDALKSGKIAGACLDVLANDPPEKNNPLLNFENVLLTPHSAFHTTEALRRCTDICIDNVEGFIGDKLQNVVNF